MTTYAQGEIAVLQNATYFQEWDGCLVVITAPLMRRFPLNMLTMKRESVLSYKALPLVEGAIELTCSCDQLRKLNDPSATKSETVHEEDEVPETVTV